MGQPRVKAATQKAIAGCHCACHRAVPLPIVPAIPVGPGRLHLRLEAEYRHRITRGICPNTNAIPRLNKIRVRIEAGIYQSDGYAFSGESWIGVQSQAGWQNSEGG